MTGRSGRGWREVGFPASQTPDPGRFGHGPNGPDPERSGRWYWADKARAFSRPTGYRQGLVRGSCIALRFSVARTRSLAAGVLLAVIATAAAPAAPTPMGGPVKVHASESTAALEHEGTFELPGGTTHFAIHWTGHPNAQLTVAMSSDGSVFGPASVVEIDEVGSSRGDGETYGAVTPASGVAALRLTTSEPLDAVSILTLDAANQVTIPLGIGAVAAGAGELPPVIPRSAWGADESIRFDSEGEIRWGLAYYPLQKFIVHHTVTGTPIRILQPRSGRSTTTTRSPRTGETSATTISSTRRGGSTRGSTPATTRRACRQRPTTRKVYLSKAAMRSATTRDPWASPSWARSTRGRRLRRRSRPWYG